MPDNGSFNSEATSTIPLELLGAIVDALAEDDLPSVKACCLTCRAFVPLCRKHIFSTIVLNQSFDNAYSPTADMFEHLILTNPTFAQYVRKIEYTILDIDVLETSLPWAFDQVAILESLSISYQSPRVQMLDWNCDLMESLGPSLLRLLRLPTLTHFGASKIKNFPAVELARCTNIQSLDLNNVHFQEQESFPAAYLPVQLRRYCHRHGSNISTRVLLRAQSADGLPIFDFSEVKKAFFVIDDGANPVLEELSRRMPNCVDVSIESVRQTIHPGQVSQLLTNCVGTLKTFTFEYFLNQENVDPLHGLVAELRALNGQNIIEGVTLKIGMHERIKCRLDEEWFKFDEVVTARGWPHLRSVWFKIEVSTYEIAQSKTQFENDLEALPTTHLKRLESRKDVDIRVEIKRTPILSY
ncbi:hypothetical protein NLJ89_g5009 [Agrocybe chaxingu]|uniref:F-box domain-containing protein n=1 Tax=Agrocybe chaxingu TaxID=84603 RepID=A0A9W8K1U9_9AGAR|nr:hypothetical protein NLJ89_g5009 [Agrocybe chaxingu]